MRGEGQRSEVGSRHDSRHLESTPQSACARAVLDYRAHGCKKFKAHLRDHLANGYVFSTPSVFALFKAVALEDNRTAWYVTYFIGDLRLLLSLLPFPLPFIAFHRLRHGREVMRVYPFDRFLRHATKRPINELTTERPGDWKNSAIVKSLSHSVTKSSP